MQLEQALRIFKLNADYNKDEVETFFNFEYSLLEERLTTGNDEQKRANKQKIVELQTAYNILLSHCPVEKKSALNHVKSSRVVVYALLVVVGAGAIGASVFTLKKKQQQANSAQTQERTQLIDAAAKEARLRKQAQQKVAKTQEKVAKPAPLSPQQIELQKLQQQSKTLLEQWQNLVKDVTAGIPTSISERKTRAEKLAEQGSLTQAIFIYQQYNQALGEHIDNVGNYIQAFSQNIVLEKQWQQLAQQEHFTAEKLTAYRQQFAETKRQLSEGKVPRYTRESLEGANLNYEVIINQGKRIGALRREYRSLKGRWQQHVRGNRFYKLTPAISELIQTAEKKSHDASEFNRLETQVYQRLINHFKQTLRR